MEHGSLGAQSEVRHVRGAGDPQRPGDRRAGEIYGEKSRSLPVGGVAIVLVTSCRAVPVEFFFFSFFLLLYPLVS